MSYVPTSASDPQSDDVDKWQQQTWVDEKTRYVGKVDNATG